MGFRVQGLAGVEFRVGGFEAHGLATVFARVVSVLLILLTRINFRMVDTPCIPKPYTLNR